MTTVAERADPRVRPVRKHNPGLYQSDGEVIRQFVVRGRELDTVLEVLRGDLDAPSCQHALIVAPRGRGKTMLLERVAAELRTDEAFAGRLLPVQFMEESYEVFDAASFWLDALFHLAREMEARDPEFARELRETHAGLTGRWREDALEGLARAAVLEAAERMDRRLVLMVENLQALSRGPEDDFGWKLREALQSEPRVILLATATNGFRGLEDAQAPFFDLFRTVSLEPLNGDECRRLWQEISGECLDGREIRPLEILTGGSPRLLVILAGLARRRSVGELMERLVVLIDDYTEYFRSQLEGLPGVERRVFLAVADLWRPSRTGEIAARARLDVRTASAMLGRLVERGAVVAEGSGKRRLYAGAERLFSIYYKLRRERDEAAVVHGVIRYLALFYTRDEMAEKFRRVLTDARNSPAILEGLARAIADQPGMEGMFSGEDAALRQRILDRAAAIRDQEVSRRTEEIRAAFNSGAFEHVIALVNRDFGSERGMPTELQGRLAAGALVLKALAHREMGDPEAAVQAARQVAVRYGNSRTPEVQMFVGCALEIIGSVHLTAGEYQEAVAVLREAVQCFGEGGEPIFQPVVAEALNMLGHAQTQLGEPKEAMRAYDELLERFGAGDVPELREQVAKALVSRAVLQLESGDIGSAIASCDETIERFGESDSLESRAQVAMALIPKVYGHTHLKQWQAALEAADQFVERFRNSTEPRIQAGLCVALFCRGLLQAYLGDPDAALANWKEVVERFGASDTPEARRLVVNALEHKAIGEAEAGRSAEVLRACDQLEARLDWLSGDRRAEITWSMGSLRAKALLREDTPEAALAAFRVAYEAFVPDSTSMMRDIQTLVPDLVAGGVPVAALTEVVESHRTKAEALRPLVAALRLEAGETVREPIEVLEIARDIRELFARKAGVRADNGFAGELSDAALRPE